MEVYSMATLTTKIQLRRDTAANLAEVVLASGEPAYATDTKKFAIGDGSTKFKSLPNSGFNVDMVDNFHFTTLGYAYQKAATLSFKRSELVNADDFIYVKMTCSNKYTSQQLRFKIVPGYDNVAGSTEVTTYSRQQNAFYLDSVYYNGNKFIGIYQPSANTDIYYLKFAKFTGTYASSPDNGSITVYSKDSALTLTLIQSGHADYKTISKYSYITVPENGIYSTYVWNTITPRSNNAYDLGSSSLKWKNIHGVTLYENGTSLANKYAAKNHTHDVNITTSTGTNELTLAYGTKYALTAGGQSFIFTMPTDSNTTYGADRGISLKDGKFGHSNTAVTAVTTAGLYKIKYDVYGHITGTESFTLPTVNNGTLTIQKNGTKVATFTANQSGNATANITVPTKVSELTNDRNFLTAETDTLQTVTTRGATTNKAITTAGLTTTSTLYITGTTGHREGIRIAPVGNLSSIWWNATGTQDYTTGQMWGITAYDKSYTLDATKTNTFRFRGPTSATATSATDQMWINTAGLVTSRGGFAKSGSSDSYVLLAGGGTKALSEFGIGTGGSLDLSDYVKGSGTANYIPKFTAANTIGDSILSADNTTVTANGSILLKQYLKINAWSGYGTGSANFWYDGNEKTVSVENMSDLRFGNKGPYATRTTDTLTENTILIGAGTSSDKYKITTSSKTITTTLGADDTTIPTSKAVTTYVTDLLEDLELGDSYQPLDADLTAIAGLGDSTTTGLLRKSGKNSWGLDSNTYLKPGDNASANYLAFFKDGDEVSGSQNTHCDGVGNIKAASYGIYTDVANNKAATWQYNSSTDCVELVW